MFIFGKCFPISPKPKAPSIESDINEGNHQNLNGHVTI